MNCLITSKQIDHIGIAVSDLESSVSFYTNILGLTCYGYETVESEHVRVAFLKIGEVSLELLQGLNDQSAITKFIKKKGEGIHHIALRVENANEDLGELKRNGIQLINETAKVGAHGNLVGFLHPHSTKGVLLELCQRNSNMYKEDEE